MGSKEDAETHSSKSEQAEKEKRKNGRGDGGEPKRISRKTHRRHHRWRREKKGGRGKVGGNARPTFSLLIREEEKGIQKRKERGEDFLDAPIGESERKRRN